MPVGHNQTMRFIFDFVGRVVRSVLRLVLFLAAGALALGFLVAVLVAVVLTALWSLLTGRKPAVFTTFARFRQASQQFQQFQRRGRSPMDRPTPGHPMPADVVDVQAHEVQDKTLHATLPLEQEPKR